MKVEGRAAEILRARSFPVLALVDERNMPHATPVWVDVDDEGRIVINTAEGRVKARLLQLGAHVGLCALDPKDPYKYVSIRGVVVERTHDGAWEMIEALSHKYTGKPYKGAREQRVTVLIEAEHIVAR